MKISTRAEPKAYRVPHTKKSLKTYLPREVHGYVVVLNSLVQAVRILMEVLMKKRISQLINNTESRKSFQ